MKSVFGESDPLVLLAILTTQLSLEKTRAIHIRDHRHDGRVIAADDAEIKLCFYSISILINILDCDPRRTDASGQYGFEICKQP